MDNNVWFKVFAVWSLTMSGIAVLYFFMKYRDSHWRS